MANARYDPDRDAKAAMSDDHFAYIMQEAFGESGIVWPTPERSQEDMNWGWDFRSTMGTIQKKAIMDLGFDTITIPCHSYDDPSYCPQWFAHGYYAPKDPTTLIRFVVIAYEKMKNVKPDGKRRNWATGTDFYFWDYTTFDTLFDYECFYVNGDVPRKEVQE